MSSSIPVYPCFLGDVISVPLEFSNAGTPIDLTGATIYVTAKADLDSEDAAALIDEKITDHEDAANGLTSFLLDLSEVDKTIPLRLTCDIVLKDSLGNPRNYGLLIIEAARPVTQATAD